MTYQTTRSYGSIAELSTRHSTWLSFEEAFQAFLHTRGNGLSSYTIVYESPDLERNSHRCFW